MDLAHLCRVLQGTLDADNASRRAAEAALTALLPTPGYIPTLLQLIQAPDVPVLGKTAAALAFKNAIVRSWHSDDPTEPCPFPVADKAAVRSVIIAAAAEQVERPILAALSSAACAIFAHDYPDRWPSLPAELLAQLGGGSPPRVAAAAGLVRLLTKHYEFKQVVAQAPAAGLVAAVFPALAALGGALVAHAAPEAARVLCAIIKAYHSVANHALPAHGALLTHEALVTWMALLHRVLTRPLAQPGESGWERGAPGCMPEDPDARPDWPWWKARKWAAKTLATWAERWGQPKLLEDDCAVKAASTAFNRAVAPQVAGALLAQLAEWCAGGRYLPPPVLAHSVRFVQSALGYASCWKALKPHLGGLIEGVLLRLYSLTPSELETFECDPAEFLRGRSDPLTTFRHPRAAAELCLGEALASRAKDAAPLLDALVTGTLAAYAGAPQPPPLALALRKEAVLAMVQDMSAYYRRDKGRRRLLEPLLTAHVLPDFASPHPQLRARACTLWATFAALRWRQPAASVEPATRGVLACLSDASDVVRFTAAASLRAFLTQSEAARELLRPHIEPLLGKLFGMLDQLGIDEVVATLEAVVECYAEQMGSLGEPILAQLLRLWETLMAAAHADDEVGAAAAPAGGGGGDDDADAAAAGALDPPALEDETAMAAEGVLSSIVTLLAVLREEGHADTVLSRLAPRLWRFVFSLLDSSATLVLEFLDHVLTITGDLVELAGEAGTLLSDGPAWAVFARMLAVYREDATDYLENMDLALEAYFAYGMARLCAPGADPAHGGNNLALWLDAVEHTEVHADEDTRERMARLVLSMLYSAAPTQAVPPPALARLLGLYVRATGDAKTRKLAVAASNVLAAALCYNTHATLAALEAAGATQAAFGAWLSALPKYRRSLSAKISILGLTCLLRQPLESLPAAVRAGLPDVLRSIVWLAGLYEAARVKEAKARAECEEDEAAWADDSGTGAAAAPRVEGETGGDGTGHARMVPAPDSEGEEDEDDDEDGGAGFGDEEDAVDEAEERAVRESAAERRARRDGDGDDCSDDRSLYDEPPPEDTPLDHLHHLLHIEECLAALGRGGAAAADVQRALPGETLMALAALAASAGELRLKGQTPGVFGPPPEEPPAPGDGPGSPVLNGAAAIR